MPSKRYCFALDLKNDSQSISEYEQHHKSVSPHIIESIKRAGIEVMDIYRIENRLFMIMETDESFSFERKREMDENDPLVQEWEALMSGYQQSLPTAKSGGKWMLMHRIFSL
jgi:L-rhamnose mutarotase